MPLEINRVALLVHPDYHLTEEFPLNTAHLSLSRRWDARVEEIVRDRNQVMFYYSAYEFDDHRIFNSRDRFNDRTRRLIYMDLLGPRFFYSYYEDYPNTTITLQADERDMFFSRDLEVEAFGEYQEKCVADWAKEFTKALKSLGARNIHLEINPDLSVRYTDFYPI